MKSQGWFWSPGRLCPPYIGKKLHVIVVTQSRSPLTFDVTVLIIAQHDVMTGRQACNAHSWEESGGAWPFLVGGLICLVDSVNERDLSLLNSYAILESGNFLEGLLAFSQWKFEAITGL
jgi:hypothetical protein